MNYKTYYILPVDMMRVKAEGFLAAHESVKNVTYIRAVVNSPQLVE
jgi:hypothetical protein